jgi:hypothetical protein
VLKGDRIYVRVYGTAGSKDPEKKEYEGIVHEGSILQNFISGRKR